MMNIEIIMYSVIGLALLCLDMLIASLFIHIKGNKKIILGGASILLFNILSYIGLGFLSLISCLVFLYISLIPLFISLLFLILKKEEKPGVKANQIVLEHERGKIIYRNPFNGFLVYGGAEAGKTASIGKPLLKQYMLNQFAGFIYDAKENDYTLTALKIKENIEYPYPIYNLDFLNPSRSYRTNIFCPSVITEPQLVPEFAELFFTSFLKEGERKDEWFNMSLGVFKGVAWVFYTEHPEICSLPHICNFIVHNSPDKILSLLKNNETARGYAGALINAEGSEKTFASILSNLSKFIGDFSANRNACYILSGDDFLYNPLEKDNPKLICVSNHFIARDIISPLIVLLFCTIAKQIRFGNQTPIVFFMDEATTFKIPDLESYPSELREYLVAFVLLTQSAGKIEKKYSKFDRSSLESNLANQFYGWTADILALENYAKQFSKAEEKTKSFTTSQGSKRSTTISSRKDIRYDGEFFGSLKPGEFVGKCKNASVKNFHTRFKPYAEGKINEMPLVREATPEIIEKYYQNLIQEVKNIN